MKAMFRRVRWLVPLAIGSTVWACGEVKHELGSEDASGGLGAAAGVAGVGGGAQGGAGGASGSAQAGSTGTSQAGAASSAQAGAAGMIGVSGAAGNSGAAGAGAGGAQGGSGATAGASGAAGSGSTGASGTAGSAGSGGGSPLQTRPIAPLSTATVTSQRPLFHWALAGADDGAELEICRDRACTKQVTTFTVTGSSGAPASALAAGTYYWRLRGAVNGVAGGAASPVWQFSVGARSATVNSSWGTTLDANGDGYADVLVGARGQFGKGGQAFLYYGNKSGPASMPLTISSPASTDKDSFGNSVASAGDVNGDGFADVIIGAAGANSNTGRAYLYLGGASGLSSGETTLVSPGDANGEFGYWVASAGDVNGDGYADVIIGCAKQNSTSAYVYLGSTSGLSTTAKPIKVPGDVTNGFSYPSAGAGDVNGDGYADVVIGSVDFNNGGGHAYVYLGSATGLGDMPITLTNPGTDQSVGFGSSVSSAGDVNGDGYADVVIGTQTELQTTGNGTIYLYLGSASGVDTTAKPLTVPDGANYGFGYFVGDAGDLDGDGFSEIVVGAPGVGNSIGAANVYFGSANGPKTPITLSALDQFSYGTSVSGAGDVDGDGYGDLLIGTSGGGQQTGEASLYFGTATGLSTSPLTFMSPAAVGAGFGVSVASVRVRARWWLG